MSRDPHTSTFGDAAQTPADACQQSSVIGASEPTQENLPPAEVIATDAGQRIARDYPHLDRRGRLRIVTTFRRQLIPPRKPGRKRCKEITAAHADWKSGTRGAELHRRHIPGFDRMSRWRRESKVRDLMDAIRSRVGIPAKLNARSEGKPNGIPG